MNYQNYRGRNRTIIEDIFVTGKKHDLKTIKNYWNGIKNPHRLNPDAFHIVSIYLKNIKKIDIEILKFFMQNYHDKVKNTFRNHPLIIAAKLERFDLVEIILNYVDIFFKNKNSYLLSEFYNIVKRDISDFLIKYTDIQKSKNRIFEFLFRNKKINPDFFLMKAVKIFVSDLSMKKFDNLRDFIPVYNYLKKYKKLVIFDEKDFIDVLGPEDSEINFKNFIKNNYNHVNTYKSMKFTNIGFNFEDIFISEHMNNNFLIKNISNFTNQFKIRMINTFKNYESFVKKDKISTFKEIFKHVFEEIYNIDEKYSIINCDLSEKDKYGNYCSLIFTYEILWLIRNNLI